MRAKGLYQEFSDRTKVAGAQVFDEPTALAFIERARQGGLAISGIELVRPSDPSMPEGPSRRLLREDERQSSWDQARFFVEMLAGRGLLFLVAVESPWSTRRARLRSIMMVVRDRTSHPMP